MTFQELLVETKDIDLNKIGVFLGEKANVIDSVSCWEEKNEWIIEIVDDRQQVYHQKGTEEYVVRKMRSHIKWRMRG